MADSVREQLQGALALLLKPLVRLLVKLGVTHAEFSETAKEVYVEVAIRYFQDSGRVNRSRIAVQTGLTRKEVANVIDRTIAAEEQAKPKSRPEKVLTGWFSDPKYTGPYGMPLELPYEESDPDVPSVVSLVRAYGADMSPKQLLNELLASACVIETGGNYKAVRRMYEPEPLSTEMINRLGNVGYWVFSTIATNMQKEKRRDFGYFERSVFADDGATDNVIEEFDVFVKEKGQSLIDEIDIWFSSNTHKNLKTEKPKDTGFYMVHYIDDGVDRASLKELLVERGIEKES